MTIDTNNCKDCPNPINCGTVRPCDQKELDRLRKQLAMARAALRRTDERETERADAATATQVKYIKEKKRAEAAEAKLAMVRDLMNSAEFAYASDSANDAVEYLAEEVRNIIDGKRVPELEDDE